jgi:phosphoribosyl 1,2-cyclic phosphodiesterase
LITHEHSDHISGVAKIARRFGIPVFALEKTWQSLPFATDIPLAERHYVKRQMTIGDLDIDFFATSHDASAPCGMVFYRHEQKVGILTDTGTITPGMREILYDLDGLVLEANHNLNMLKMGPYPAWLKKRIASDIGHLSNQQAASLLADITTENTQAVILAHLSEANNTDERALEEVYAQLAARKIAIHYNLSVAPQRSPHELVDISSRLPVARKRARQVCRGDF